MVLTALTLECSPARAVTSTDCPGASRFAVKTPSGLTLASSSEDERHRAFIRLPS